MPLFPVISNDDLGVGHKHPSLIAVTWYSTIQHDPVCMATAKSAWSALSLHVAWTDPRVSKEPVDLSCAPGVLTHVKPMRLLNNDVPLDLARLMTQDSLRRRLRKEDKRKRNPTSRLIPFLTNYLPTSTTAFSDHGISKVFSRRIMLQVYFAIRASIWSNIWACPVYKSYWRVWVSSPSSTHTETRQKKASSMMRTTFWESDHAWMWFATRETSRLRQHQPKNIEVVVHVHRSFEVLQVIQEYCRLQVLFSFGVWPSQCIFQDIRKNWWSSLSIERRRDFRDSSC